MAKGHFLVGQEAPAKDHQAHSGEASCSFLIILNIFTIDSVSFSLRYLQYQDGDPGDANLSNSFPPKRTTQLQPMSTNGSHAHSTTLDMVKGDFEKICTLLSLQLWM